MSGTISAELPRSRLKAAEILRISWLAHALALLGGLVSLAQLSLFIHNQVSVLDEGMYLYEGYLFSIGRYIPFQDYGPRMYQLPLAYLIPGFIQRWFGPGLRVGRYFAVFLVCMMLLALWIAARRLGGRWLAAAAVWVFALNPAPLKMYSQADSQPLAACILMWVMALTIGGKRPAWQIALGSFLAGVLLLVRVNLLPVLPLLVLYILWEYGWKLALLSAAAGLFPFIGMQAVYWPNVLRIWAYWLPERISPFLNPWRPPVAEVRYPMTGSNLLPRLNSFSDGLRLHFVIFTGVAAAWITWPRRSRWVSASDFRSAVFLSILFPLLALMHGWAALVTNNCIFCFPGYLSFFIGLGLLLAAVSFRYWFSALSPLRTALLGAVVISITVTWAHSIAPLFNTAITDNLAQSLLNIRFPFLPGRHEIWIYFANRLDIEYVQMYRIMRVLPAVLFGLLLGCALLLLVFKASPLLSKIAFLKPYSPGMQALIVMILAGLLLGPSEPFGGGYHSYDCAGDVLAAAEDVGAHLQEYIPENSLVFYRGTDSPVPLLYLPQVKVFPPLLTADYEFHVGGDEDALLKYGWWTRSIAQRWLKHADIVIVDVRYRSRWLLRALRKSGRFEQLPSSPLTEPCRLDTHLLLYRKK